MLRVRSERKCLFLYSNFRSTIQLYKYIKDFLGGVRDTSTPLGSALGVEITWKLAVRFHCGVFQFDCY